MNILIVSTRFPYPTTTADRLTVYQLLKHFSRRHTIDLFACTAVPLTKDEIAAVADYCRTIKTIHIPPLLSLIRSAAAVAARKPIQPNLFYAARGRRIIRQLVRDGKYDVLYAHTIRAARFLLNLEPRIPALRVLAMQISMALNYARLANHERNFIYRVIFRYEAAMLRRYESNIASRFDRSLVISDVDRLAISARPSSLFFECPHGVTLDEKPPDSQSRKADMIVFSGRMDYRPNVDAALFFVKKYSRVSRPL